MTKLIARTVEGMIIDAVRQTTGNGALPVSRNAVEEAAQVVINQTNNEPWTQSYVTLGSLGSILTSVGFIVTDLTNGGGIDVAQMGQSIAVILGAGLALWGRWRAKTPLGAVK